MCNVSVSEMAKEKLASSQVRLKMLFDRRAELRQFSPEDQVLALLPIVGSPDLSYDNLLSCNNDNNIPLDRSSLGLSAATMRKVGPK